VELYLHSSTGVHCAVLNDGRGHLELEFATEDGACRYVKTYRTELEACVVMFYLQCDVDLPLHTQQQCCSCEERESSVVFA
jgi:hypothetical protein